MIAAIRIILAILLLVCLADMPYGYFQFVRFASMLAFALLAFDAFKRGEETEVIIYIGLALLFQPFLKVAFGRTIWNVVDVIVAVGLVVSVLPGNRRRG
ncbi:MAG: hypothetical protein NVV59_07050 [Chitinophagaceae bacterium]|nr:hypothetical protein [Chitinophagaceae bacterium]